MRPSSATIGSIRDYILFVNSYLLIIDIFLPINELYYACREPGKFGRSDRSRILRVLGGVRPTERLFSLVGLCFRNTGYRRAWQRAVWLSLPGQFSGIPLHQMTVLFPGSIA